MNLSDELRNQLLESAAWGKAGITPTERIDERGAKKGDEGAGRKKGDKDYSDGGERKGDKSKTHKGLDDHTEAEYDEDAEEISEAVHVCPLCTSELDEQISEESLLEHLDVVLGLVDRLSQLNEGDEDIDEVIDTALEELLLGSQEEEEEE